ncbi:MAG: hypothetical protein ACRCT1_18745 [Microcoleaceae cyanobacterium]
MKNQYQQAWDLMCSIMSAIVGDSSWIFPRHGAVSQCQFWDNFPIADKMEFPDYNDLAMAQRCVIFTKRW